MSLTTLPHLSLAGQEEHHERSSRLLHSYDVMCAVVRVLWPAEGLIADPNAVSWNGAILSLHEAEGHLYVSWKDEDHWEKFAKVADLAWTAAGFESGRVIHANADIDGLPLPSTQPMY